VKEVMTQEYLTVEEAARRLHAHPKHLYKLVKRGELVGIRLGRLVRVAWPPRVRSLKEGWEEEVQVGKGEGTD
jgi:excisionase family DNA binding protein